MRAWVLWIGMIVLYFSLASAILRAQDGEALYKAHCAICHDAGEQLHAPGRDVLKQLTPEQILSALEKGVMKSQAAERSRAQRRALAEYLSGKPFSGEPENPIPSSAYCAGGANAAPETSPGAVWNGWGVTETNTRFQPAEAAGISPDDVPRLKLKWAFGFPGASSASAQPVVWGGRVYVGSYEGDVYSLDAKTGCIHWSLSLEAGVRSAASVAKAKNGSLTVYFGDTAANVYAVNAAAGKVLWKVKVDGDPLATITGSPKLFEGRLYVPVSSRDESQVGNSRFECCRFRGSVVALDTATGKRIWKTYVIAEEPRPTQKNRAGTQLYGPSGGAIWNSPTIDVRRGAVYAGTGNDYSTPAVGTSDSVVAFDLKSGKVRWSRQKTENDIWNSSCRPNGDPATCPDEDAPDFDFAASPILLELKGGRRVLVAGNKSGMVYAFDPDHDGKDVWSQRVGKGGTSGGVMFGPAADSETVYVAVSDAKRVNGKPDPKAAGGMVALNVATGEKVWNTPNPPCQSDAPCSPSQAAAVSAIPGVVFAGSNDGHMRAYSAKDGNILWDYDTAHEYQTVNGVKAKGGSINDGGPAIAGGMLFTNSGYSHHSGVIPGNVLLAFSAQ